MKLQFIKQIVFATIFLIFSSLFAEDVNYLEMQTEMNLETLFTQRVERVIGNSNVVINVDVKLKIPDEKKDNNSIEQRDVKSEVKLNLPGFANPVKAKKEPVKVINQEKISNIQNKMIISNLIVKMILDKDIESEKRTLAEQIIKKHPLYSSTKSARMTVELSTFPKATPKEPAEKADKPQDNKMMTSVLGVPNNTEESQPLTDNLGWLMLAVAVGIIVSQILMNSRTKKKISALKNQQEESRVSLNLENQQTEGGGDEKQYILNIDQPIRVLPPEEDADLKFHQEYKPFKFLQNIPNDKLIKLISTLNIEQISVLVTQLPLEKSSIIMSNIDEKQLLAVSQEVVNKKKFTRSMLEKIEEEVQKEFLALLNPDTFVAGGKEFLANLLVSSSNNQDLMKNVLDHFNKTGDNTIREMVFPFEDIQNVDDEILISALVDIDRKDLAIALSDQEEELKEKVINCLPAPAQRVIKMQMTMLDKALPGKQVFRAQRKIINLIRSQENFYNLGPYHE